MIQKEQYAEKYPFISEILKDSFLFVPGGLTSVLKIEEKEGDSELLKLCPQSWILMKGLMTWESVEQRGCDFFWYVSSTHTGLSVATKLLSGHSDKRAHYVLEEVESRTEPEEYPIGEQLSQVNRQNIQYLVRVLYSYTLRCDHHTWHDDMSASLRLVIYDMINFNWPPVS